MQFACARAAAVRAWIAPAAAMMLLAMAQAAAAQRALPSGFVYLRDVDPTIVQDMRYAGSDNFVGHPLPGYAAAECILRQDVAAALKRVQAELAAAGFLLKVYDFYRPMRAVRAMVEWVNDGRSGAATKRFFPRLTKNTLLRGYIAIPACDRRRDRPDADQDAARIGCAVRSRCGLRTLHRAGRPAQPRQ